MELAPFFTQEFYQRKVPVWGTIDKEGVLGDPAPTDPALGGPVLLAFVAGLLLAGVIVFVRLRLKRRGTA